MNKLEKDIIKQCGGFCQVCLEHDQATNQLAVIYMDGNTAHKNYNNVRVLCQTCNAKREGRPYPGIPKIKLKQLTIFDV
jgi:5-methylcytosine-specific restriction endonuclease McrA